MTDENQRRDRRKGPWLLILALVLAIGAIAVGIVVLTGASFD
jgi:hypothetical protein